MAPNRPRAHQLEQLSINAFRNAIPDSWVFRELGQDYGIDGEIEIFDDMGKALGIKFLVQLKSTDKSNDKKAFSVTLSKGTAEYYFSLDLPVLIVLYQTHSKKMYVRWFHTFDPHCVKKEARYTSFKFNKIHEWNEATPKEIFHEVNQYRELHSPHITTPVKFEFFVDEGVLENTTVFTIFSKLQEEANEVSQLISINSSSSKKQEALHRIEISKERIAIFLAGMHGYTIHISEGYPPHLIETLHFDILIGIALALDWYGHSSLGARITIEYVHKSHLKNDLANVSRMSACLANAGYFTQAMELSNVFFDDENLINNALLLMGWIIAGHGHALTTAEREYSYSILQKMAVKADTIDKKLAAALHYNCGTLLTENKRYAKAVSHYKKAAREYPDYLNRNYFWSELGGVFFETRHFKTASKAYECCVSIDPTNLKVKPYYADSLMFSGHYKKAEEEFTNYLEKTEIMPDDTEWQLKKHALGFILECLGIEEQTRDLNQAAKTFKEIDFEDHEKFKEMAERVFEHDALHSLTWYNTGITCLQKEEWQLASMGFLFAALTVPHDIEAWYNCLAASHKCDDTQLFAGALFVAYFYNKEKFIRFIESRLKDKADYKFYAQLNQMTAELAETNKSRPFERKIRIHHPDGDFDLAVAMKK